MKDELFSKFPPDHRWTDWKNVEPTRENRFSFFEGTYATSYKYYRLFIAEMTGYFSVRLSGIPLSKGVQYVTVFSGALDDALNTAQRITQDIVSRDGRGLYIGWELFMPQTGSWTPWLPTLAPKESISPDGYYYRHRTSFFGKDSKLAWYIDCCAEKGSDKLDVLLFSPKNGAFEVDYLSRVPFSEAKEKVQHWMKSVEAGELIYLNKTINIELPTHEAWSRWYDISEDGLLGDRTMQATYKVPDSDDFWSLIFSYKKGSDHASLSLVSECNGDTEVVKCLQNHLLYVVLSSARDFMKNVASTEGLYAVGRDATAFIKDESEKTAVKQEADAVNHPPHYTSHPSNVECIDITQHMGFCLGNAMKYIWRADLKGNAIQDLEKARWYIDKELEKRQGNNGKSDS